MLLYKLWKLIPADIARTTPGKAIGFCLIPFFNFYWIFVAYKGLGEDMNKTLARRGITYRVSSVLGVCSPVFILLGIIPLVGIISFIVQFFFLKSVKNGAILMLKQSGQ